MDKPINVRIAEESDAPNLFWLLMNEQYTDWPMGLPPTPKAVSEVVIAACARNNSCAGIIDGPNGTILGTIGIRAEIPWWTETTILGQTWLYVSPQARQEDKLVEDIFAFAEWHRQDMSARIGYDIVLENSVLSYSRLAAKIRLWGRYGKQVGATFWARGATEDVQGRQQDDQRDEADRPEGIGGVRGHSSEGAEPIDAAHARLRRPNRGGSESGPTGRDPGDQE